MAKMTNAQLRAEIRRLKSEKRSIRSNVRLKKELRTARHERAKASFASHVGRFVRAGHSFKVAVKLAQGSYKGGVRKAIREVY